jgi:hypothetical protein
MQAWNRSVLVIGIGESITVTDGSVVVETDVHFPTDINLLQDTTYNMLK